LICAAFAEKGIIAIVPIGGSASLHGLPLPKLIALGSRNQLPNVLTLCKTCHNNQGAGLAWIDPNGSDDRSAWTLATADRADSHIQSHAGKALYFNSDPTVEGCFPTRSLVDWAVNWAAKQRAEPRKTTKKKEESDSRKQLKAMCRGQACPAGGICPCRAKSVLCGLIPRKQCECGCRADVCDNRSAAAAAAPADD